MYGIETPLRWPMKEPDEVLDYSWNASAVLVGPVTDTILSASVSISPYGNGEMTASSLIVNPATNIVTAWLTGGVAGRDYTIRIEVSTAGGRLFERLIRLLIDPALAVYPSPPAAATEFGPVTTWAPGP